MERRYQVFVSSTYTDLRDERVAVMQALMELDCIPAGMELFPAMDEEQFKFIKRVIDECDYYVLIIGGRYGSTGPDGISYTEMEYEYAVSREIPVIALLHGDAGSLPTNRSDMDRAKFERLRAFRDRVSTGRLVRYWKDAGELAGLVTRSLVQTIRIYPAIGWVRANAVANIDALSELNELRKQNEELRKQLEGARKELAPLADDLAPLTDSFTLHGFYNDGQWNEWEATTSWSEILILIGPHLLKQRQERYVENVLTSNLCDAAARERQMLERDFNTIKLQLLAHRLITAGPATGSRSNTVWELSEHGQKVLFAIATVKARTPSD